MYPKDFDNYRRSKVQAAPLVQGTVPSRKAKVTQVERVMFFSFVSLFSKKTLETLGEMANH